MPSEKKSKKHKVTSKATSAEILKPLAHYADDRLELTKQLFSCLKTKEIKQRLPHNLQNKSIERIQQICLDEVLGISTKRLVSIINNTICPENTDSDDSELEQVDEHISLEEISSDSEAEAVQKKGKSAKKASPTKKAEATVKNSKEKTKNPKEMTMLELLELQARARAIRSQLALEPVAKIELDSDDEDGAKSEISNQTSSPAKENKTAPETKLKTAVAPRIETKTSVSPARRIVVASPPEVGAAPPSKPVKLKRNYKTQNSNGASSSTVTKEKESSPSKAEPEGNFADDEDDDDVIRMEPSPETFFISDSDEEPAVKKSPAKIEEPSVDENTPEEENGNEAKDEKPTNDKVLEKKSETISTQHEVTNPTEQPKSPPKSDANDNETDDDIVHLMSDTEIELHHHSDKEEEPKSENIEKVREKSPLPQSNIQSDDDVVEINNSSDDEIMNDSEKSAGESSKASETTWEQRWLSSSKTQNILKTTQLASKVRTNLLKTKNTQKAIAKEKEETEKAMKEKISNAEEGSMEQFKVIREKSN